MPTMVWSLRWCDVDPALHGFDPGPARAIAMALVPPLLASTRAKDAAATDPKAKEARREEWVRGADPDLVEDEIDRALIGAYGYWAAGWRWASSEPGGGGPVNGWCCGRDSLTGDDAPERVVAALVEWRVWLEELAELFAELGRTHAGLDLAEQTNRAAARLLPLVVARTQAEDAWYSTFVRVMAWYLERLVGSESATALIETAIGGRFHSWVEPSPEVADETCIAIGLAVADFAEAAPAERDALAGWLAVRAVARWDTPSHGSRAPSQRDGHREYIEKQERARDPERAARMLEALALARASAGRGEPLDFERLAAWQCVVLGRAEVRFRTGDAFAKGGRERYPLAEGTRADFAACLAEANASGPAPLARAARAYLDVCFFHPFDDGNARAARLAMDHVLTRAGLTLCAAEPLFVVSRSALDHGGVGSFLHLVSYLAARHERS